MTSPHTSTTLHTNLSSAPALCVPVANPPDRAAGYPRLQVRLEQACRVAVRYLTVVYLVSRVVLSARLLPRRDGGTGTDSRSGFGPTAQTTMASACDTGRQSAHAVRGYVKRAMAARVDQGLSRGVQDAETLERLVTLMTRHVRRDIRPAA